MTDPNYTGSTTGTLVISPRTAIVTLSSLHAEYDGNPHAATVTTTPAGVSVAVTYNGSPTPPTAVGSYAVSVAVTDPTYTGSATGTLVIALPNYVWIVNSNGSLSALDSNGTANSSAITAGGMGIAIDQAGHIWSINAAGTGVAVVGKTGAVIATGYTDGHLSTPSALTIDGNGSAWIVNGNNTVSVIANDGIAITSTAAYSGSAISAPTGVAIDISGNVWIANSGNDSVTEILGGAAPVAPLAAAVQNKTMGEKP